MKLPRLSLLAAAALCCAAFAISCESDDPRNAIAPFWTDGDVDGGADLNGGKGGAGANGGLNGQHGGAFVVELGTRGIRSVLRGTDDEEFRRIAENVALFVPDAPREKIEWALSVVGLDDLVASLPQGVDELIGEGGRVLSGGQAHRIALARILLDPDRRILIVDEPTAHLDFGNAYRFVELVENGILDGPEAEAVVSRSLRPLLDAGADMIVLGCTHYPFLQPLIERIAGPGVTVIDPAPAAARHLLHVLEDRGLVRRDGQPTKIGDPKAADVRLFSSGPRAALERIFSIL